MKTGISIIIPCYNTAKYIEKCFKSILKQNLEEYEVILVDDCSTDDTVKMIQKYSKGHPQFKLLSNEKNSGAGYSRNQALKEAKYDIISFIDSDDYLEDNYYEALLTTMKKDKADVVVCDMYIKYDASMNETDIRAEACSGTEISKENFLNTGHAASPCNKLIKKYLLEKFPFAEGIMNEDIASILAILVYANKVSYTRKTYYNYLQRPKSVQNSGLSNIRFDLFKALDILEKRIKHARGFKEYFDIIIYQQVIMFFVYVPMKEKNFWARYKFLKKLSKYTEKYNIKQNHYYWNFLAIQGSKHKLYYKFLFKFYCGGNTFLASLVISFYLLYSSRIIKSIIPELGMEDLIKAAKKQQKKRAKVNLSVVVPNYNYAAFMYQRLYSILYQTEKISELIILDDCSTDNSREVLDKIVEELSPYIFIKKVYNEQNSGSAFKQWQKGFSLASGDYVWIAEADDYCRNNFLRQVIQPLTQDDSIVLSYADTALINKECKIFMNSIRAEVDIMKTGHWDTSYVNDGKKEIKNYAYVNCTIANVSSVVFKNGTYKDLFKKSSAYKQAGDWLFYIGIMEKGKVAYANKPLNFYRVHGNNVTSVTKKQAHFDEVRKVHKELSKKYKFTQKQKKEIEKRYAFLRKVWLLDETK